MAEPKQVTIIIPCLKKNALLYKCIEACLSQNTNAEILIVTEDISPPARDYKDVSYLNVEHMNMSKKRNLAALQSKAEFIALIDSDAYPEKGWVTNALRELRQDESIGMVGGPELSPPDEILSERWVGLASKSFLTTGAHSFRKSISPRRYYTEMSSCNLFMRKTEYLKIGGMDESLFICEDHDLGKRVLERLQKKILFSPEVIVYHKNRAFIPFLIQRYARGMATAMAIKSFLKDFTWEDLKNFRLELFMAPGFIVFLLSGILMFWWFPWIYLYGVVISLYVFVILLQTFKISDKKRDYPGVFLTLFSGTIIAGVGALLSLLNINPDIKKLYRNKNDE